MEAVLNGLLGQTILGGKVVTIGRLPTNQIVLGNDNQISGRHAEIHPEAQGYRLIDLGSINGTFVNGQRLTSNVPYTLKVGDTIRIGQMTFFFEVRGAYQMASIGHPPHSQQQRPQQSSSQYLSPQGGSQPQWQPPPPPMPPQQPLNQFVYSPPQQHQRPVNETMKTAAIILFIASFLCGIVGAFTVVFLIGIPILIIGFVCHIAAFICLCLI